MQVTFSNGTDRQVALFQEAVDECQFDFARLQVTVTVEWRPNLPDGHNEFALTTIPPSPADACGKPTTALVLLRTDLDDPHRRGNEGDFPDGTFVGDDFFKETVIHELGHVFAGHFDAAQIAEVAQAFGGSASDWPAPTGIVDWGDRLQEGQAESFKDIYLPARFRKFDDRANWHLNEAGYERYLAMVDTVCPCSPGTSGLWTTVGVSTFFNIQHMLFHSTDGHYYARVKGGASFNLGSYDPNQIQPGAPWKIQLPHLRPLSKLLDGVAFGTPIDDTANAYIVNAAFPPPPPATAYDDSSFPSFIDTDGELFFQLRDDAGIIGTASLTISPSMAAPDDVSLEIVPPVMPTSGLASVDMLVPDGYWFRAAGATILDTLWRLRMRGPGTEPNYAAAILAPLKSSVPCPRVRRPPYPYKDPTAGRAPPGVRKHPRQVFGAPAASVSPSVTPVRAEQTRARGATAKGEAVRVGLSPEQAEAARR